MEFLRPYTIVFATTSIDGRIASISGFSKLSCPEDKRRQYWLRSKVDAVIVGVNTVIVDNPTLRPKEFHHSRDRYYRIVIDGNLRIPEDARILDTSQYPTIIVTSIYSDNTKKNRLISRGIEVLEIDDRVPLPLPKVLESLLKEYGIKVVMIEGGGETLWWFFKYRVVDEIRITYAPIILGGRDAVSLVMGQGFSDKREAPELELEFVGVCKCRREIHTIYRTKSRSGIPAEQPDIGSLMNFDIAIDMRSLK